ncbi:FUSC family protein [Sphingomonas abietis]|uniref:FUSC family protein n=1 Tax=Sphingomonas abietis TaxID=3012344 RepID=A0ABY7NSQ0_9SPHN|nr:FUSC family protein [Sphingomonas abietis]WBO22979.1 FUSC family protein [Sphingomonas abietis]
MKADAQAVLFSVKCFVAAMLAYYIALRIGLNRPFWAVVTSYIIAQPLAGAVLSKAVFRLMGTALGATASVILVPTFVNEPAVLSLALALWLGFCFYLAQLDRTPRSYIFLLAGYTASIIGFPSVETPGAIFDTAILRVQEITIGILCASLVHGAVFPRTVTAQLLRRIDIILADAGRWSVASMAGAREARLDLERRRLAVDVLELHQLSIHLPFDTARILPRVRTVRALQDCLSLFLPLASTIEDRLVEVALCRGGLPEPVGALVARVQLWIENDVTKPDREETAALLIADARALEPTAAWVSEPDLVWRDMLLLNLLSRLAEMVATLRDAHILRDQVRSHSVRAVSPRVVALLAGTSSRPLHLDRGLAIRAALGTIATIGLGCAFWIGTAWKEGAGAVLIAGIACALFGGLENPRAMIGRMQLGSTIGLLTSIVYAYTIMPRLSDFVTLAATLAPMLLLMGVLMGKPATFPVGVGILIGFPQTVGLYATYTPAFGAALNGAIAQFVGIGFAMVTVGLFLTIGAEDRVARLARAGWRDVALRARGRAPDSARWLSRMLDRVGLMLPAMSAGSNPGKPLLDALIDMRIGFVAGELDALRGRATDEERAAIADALSGLGNHFGRLSPRDPALPEPGVLADIDRAVAVFARDEELGRRREGLILLTSLRRNLFPAAPAYGAAA